MANVGPGFIRELARQRVEVAVYVSQNPQLFPELHNAFSEMWIALQPEVPPGLADKRKTSMPNKLLFAVYSNNKMSITYTTPNGHTKSHALEPAPASASALMSELINRVPGVTGFQVYSEHSDTRFEGKRLEALISGGPQDIPEPDDDLAALRDAVKTDAFDNIANLSDDPVAV